MTRDKIMREIADLDRQINSVVGQSELPGLDSRPFPKGSWMLAILCFGWYLFGGVLPEISSYHGEFGEWGLYLGGFFTVFAFIGTISWLFRRRGGTGKFRESSEKVKTLQDQRRELQMHLKELDEE